MSFIMRFCKVMYTVLITIFIIAICGIVLDIIAPEEDDADDVWKWM